MSSWAPAKYKTANWPPCNDPLKRRGSLAIWFDPEMSWAPPPGGKRGRQQRFSDAATETCLTLKVLFGMPLRQTAGFVQSLLRLAGLHRAVPDFSTLCRRHKTRKAGRPFRGGTGPLNLLTDSTGIKAEGAGERNARRHVGARRRIWRRLPGDHRRSRAETKMHWVKLLGQSLRARDVGRQVAEIRIRIAVLNHYTALGIAVTEAAG